MTSGTPGFTFRPGTETRIGSIVGAQTTMSAESFSSLGSMEGVYDPVVAVKAPPDAAAVRRALLKPGYAVAGIVAALAYLIHFVPAAPFSVPGPAGMKHPISATIIAILVGLLVRNVFSLPASIFAGCKHIVKKIIPVAIVLTGAGLNLASIADVGIRALFITLVCIAVAMLAGYYVSRMLGLSWKTALLLGTGTGICGNSAIVAVAPLVDAEEDDLVLSIGTVNLFGLLAMLAWPIIGNMLHIGDEAFGVWTGTSIHAVPQVVAAGFAFSPEAGALATLVKLLRVTMLAPLVFILAIFYAKHHPTKSDSSGGLTVRYARLVPWFVWGFVIFAVLNTLGLLPTLSFHLIDIFSAGGANEMSSYPLSKLMTQAGKVLLTLAMAAIGLEVNLRVIGRVGVKAFQAGLISTLILGAVSLGLIVAIM